MNITIKDNEDASKMRFEDLRPGDVFQIRQNGMSNWDADIFMMLDPRCKSHQCFNLKTKAFTYITPENTVDFRCFMAATYSDIRYTYYTISKQ